MIVCVGWNLKRIFSPNMNWLLCFSSLYWFAIRKKAFQSKRIFSQQRSDLRWHSIIRIRIPYVQCTHIHNVVRWIEKEVAKMRISAGARAHTRTHIYKHPHFLNSDSNQPTFAIERSDSTIINCRKLLLKYVTTVQWK